MTVLTGPGEEAVAANKASWGGVGPQDSTPDDKKIHQLATTSFFVSRYTNEVFTGVKIFYRVCLKRCPP